MKLRLKLLIIFLICIKIIASQDSIISINYYSDSYIRNYNHSYDTIIKTPRIFKQGWELSMPLIKLNADEYLTFMFDDLRSEVRDYYYEIRHCNSDWEFSNLSFYDYSDGFEMHQITDYEYSFNTLVNYIHYEVTLPNDECPIRKSGNYLIIVYDSYEKENPVLIQRFRIVEHLVSIAAEAKQSKRYL